MPGGRNGAAVSDPQDIKRNEDLARTVPKTTIEVAESLACKGAAQTYVASEARAAEGGACDPSPEGSQETRQRGSWQGGAPATCPAAQTYVGSEARAAEGGACDLSPEAGQQSDSRAREGQGSLPVSPAAHKLVGLAALDAFSVQCDPSTYAVAPCSRRTIHAS